ncbi:alpha/beta hydrolase [Cytophagaceae bacterium ABcell3]|nr:alpha/beta hydrolase [Cytophagaceae bacterium ABcell3]
MKEGTTTSSYGILYFQSHGNKDNPTVVFIHGVGMDHRTFAEQIESLKENYHVILWDLPGHGNSTLQNYKSRYTEMAADCLNELLTELKISKAVLVGQSLGSMISQYFLLKYPKKVIATAHVPGIELKSHAGNWAKAFIPLFMGMINLIPAGLFHRSFGRHRAVKPEVQNYLSKTIEKTGKKLVLKITKDMTLDLIERNPEPEKKSILITYGQKDLFFIRKAARNWHKKYPSGLCVEIPEANHIANQDNPAAFNKHLGIFLKDIVGF